MEPENRSFLIRGEDGLEYGPVDLDELRDWVEENRAGLGTDVRLDEPGASWHPWQTYPELVALLAEVNVTSPALGVPGMTIAPMGRRVAAFALDLILIILLYLPTVVVVTVIYMPDLCARYIQYIQYVQDSPQLPITPLEIPLSQQLIFNMIFNLILTLYVTGFLVAHGQTPAKALLRLRVVDQFGEKPSPVRAFLRALVLIFSMNLLFIPLTYAFFNPQRRTLHDFVAGTYVVEA
jgi:uncharacterized RDD family membrane protein YckC